MSNEQDAAITKLIELRKEANECFSSHFSYAHSGREYGTPDEDRLKEMETEVHCANRSLQAHLRDPATQQALRFLLSDYDSACNKTDSGKIYSMDDVEVRKTLRARLLAAMGITGEQK